MTSVECSGCDAVVDEAEATSLTELYGIRPARDPQFCRDCVDRFESGLHGSF
ncbi:hypothetical protein [Halorarum salinum]|uniref:Uncharacterized protein n=1 Tax=Halorarum salinum TaxID=2743089 RepID=A0A7D5QAI1_9EURY|nr:hypothetical protein [Halobaculum salinum]QLG61758.1 hypothetical protein HUG12_08455 [Halobaculum salinum]